MGVIIGFWAAILVEAFDDEGLWTAAFVKSNAWRLGLQPAATLSQAMPPEGVAKTSSEQLKLDAKLENESVAARPIFLSSPLLKGRISSRFQRARWHPILQIKRPHHGVDYAAPVGTPVVAIGDGVIKHLRHRRHAGRMLVVRHAHGYETSYLHLSRFAPRLAIGQRVRMGQVIGYVGRSGLSTGPHLHFELRVHGKLIDPEQGQPEIRNSTETVGLLEGWRSKGRWRSGRVI